MAAEDMTVHGKINPDRSQKLQRWGRHVVVSCPLSRHSERHGGDMPRSEWILMPN
jgi:hypothetical protein